VTALRPASGFDEASLLGLATVASADGGQDPVDTATSVALSKGVRLPETAQVHSLRSRKEVIRGDGRGFTGKIMQVIKGAYAVIGLAPPLPELSGGGERTEGAGLFRFSRLRPAAA
jgi:H+-transporting ATPase